MEIINLVYWSIWMARNEYIFRGLSPNIYRCGRIFKEEISLLLHKKLRNPTLALRIGFKPLFDPLV
jgi:hypothetical protein